MECSSDNEGLRMASNKVKKRKIKHRSAKNKGKRFQNEIAQCISDLLGIPVEKDGDIESRQMGMSGVDVILRGKAKELFPFAVECKNCEAWHMPKWIEQARANIGSFVTWLLFVKKNNYKPIVVMEADEFFRFYYSALKYYEHIEKTEN